MGWDAGGPFWPAGRRRRRRRAVDTPGMSRKRVIVASHPSSHGCERRRSLQGQGDLCKDCWNHHGVEDCQAYIGTACRVVVVLHSVITGSGAPESASIGDDEAESRGRACLAFTPIATANHNLPPSLLSLTPTRPHAAQRTDCFATRQPDTPPLPASVHRAIPPYSPTATTARRFVETVFQTRYTTDKPFATTSTLPSARASSKQTPARAIIAIPSPSGRRPSRARIPASLPYPTLRPRPSTPITDTL